jgi:cytochrome c biogenesis protein CcmG/thiol:disulfide interchange protein DsbE
MSDYKNTPVTAPAEGGGGSKVGLIVVAVVAVVVVVVGLVVLLGGGGDDGGSAEAGTGAEAAAASKQETASVTISGEDLPPLPDSGPIAPTDSDPGVGVVPPKLTGQTFDGSELVIDPEDGTPKMVMFVAHWCPHCQKEVPLVQDFIEQGRVPDGVEIYSVATATDRSQNNYPPSSWLSGVGWQPKVLLDNESQDAFASWGGTGYPYFVAVGADGKVVQRGSGEIGMDEFGALLEQAAATGGGTTDNPASG